MSRVKLCAAQIIESKHSEDDSIDLETIQIALDPKSIVPKQDEEKAMSAQMVAEVEQATVDVQEDNLKLSAVEVAALRKSTTRKTAKKSPTTKSPKASPKKPKTVSQQISMDDIAIIDLLEQNHVNYTDNRATSGSIWLMGGHELDSVVEEARNLGVEFQFKGHWWKSI